MWHCQCRRNRARGGVEGFAGLQIPGGDVVLLVGGGVEEVAVFRLVIAEAKEERDAVAGPLEGIAEDDGAVVDVGLIDGDAAAPFRWHAEQAVGELVSHEDVAHVHVDVGIVDADVLHGPPEELHVGVYVDVRIGGDGETESGAARSGGVEGPLATGIEEGGADVAMADAVVILGVGLQAGDRHFGGVGKLGLGVVDVINQGRGGDGVFAGQGAVFDEHLLVRGEDYVQRDAAAGGHAEEFRATHGGIGQRRVHRVEVVA